MKIKRLIELTEKYGISGYENEVSALLEKELSSLGFSCEIDDFGNVVGHRSGQGKHILLEAHMDQVGMMVSEITDDGFVLFSPVGGLDMRILPSQEVIVHAKEAIKGVICVHPSDNHENNEKAPDLKNLCIDVGLGRSARERVAVGDRISFSAKSFIQNGYLFGCGLDNRVSIEAVLSLLGEMDSSAEFTVLFAVQEEVGHFGATVAQCYGDVGLAIVLDVTFGKTHDDTSGTFECGKGPAIGFGPSVSYKDAQAMRRVAEQNGISHQIEVMGGSSGTDAWVIQLLEEGIPTVMLSIPLRYMHTPIEQIALSDVDEAVALLKSFITEVCQND